MEKVVIEGKIENLIKYIDLSPYWAQERTDENESFLHLCVKYRKFELLLYILSKNYPINVQNSAGDTALHAACNDQLENAVKILLEHKVDYRLLNKSGESALHKVIYNENFSILQQFVEFDCDLNSRNSSGETILHLAVDMGLDKIAEKLIQLGAGLNIQDNEGMSPLHLACKLNNTKLVQVLIRKKAKTDLLTNRNDSILSICLKHGSLDSLYSILDTGISISSKDLQTAREISKPSIFQQISSLYNEQSSTLTRSPESSTHSTSNSSLLLYSEQIQTLSTENEKLKKELVLVNSSKNIEEIQNILIENCIGRGEFGEVYKGKWRNTEVAVKKFFNSQDFCDEVQVLACLRHPNIVLLMGVNSQDRMLVTEYMERGNLSQVLLSDLRIKRTKLIQFAIDIIEGLLFLHSAQPFVVHRDLKSANCLVDRNFRVKIADFGLARVRDNTLQDSETFGTFPYMSPEVIAIQKYSKKSDVYAFGVLLNEILSRKKPFEGLAPVQIVYQVVHLVSPI